MFIMTRKLIACSTRRTARPRAGCHRPRRRGDGDRALRDEAVEDDEPDEDSRRREALAAGGEEEHHREDDDADEPEADPRHGGVLEVGADLMQLAAGADRAVGDPEAGELATRIVRLL